MPQNQAIVWENPGDIMLHVSDSTNEWNRLALEVSKEQRRLAEENRKQRIEGMRGKTLREIIKSYDGPIDFVEYFRSRGYTGAEATVMEPLYAAIFYILNPHQKHNPHYQAYDGKRVGSP